MRKIGSAVEHQEIRQCICRPRVEEYGLNAIIIHNSFDGREYFEEEDDQTD